MDIKVQVIQFKGYMACLVQEIIFDEKPCFYIHQKLINSVKDHMVTQLQGIIHWFHLNQSPVN